LDLLSKMLALDPSKRIIIKEVLKHRFMDTIPNLKGSNYSKLIKSIEKEENAKSLSKKKK